MNDSTALGTVTFTIDGTRRLIGVIDTNGDARVVVANLSVCTHRITATYGGSALYLPSTSSTLNQVVNRAATTTRVVSSANPAARNHTVTFTVTVTANNPGVGVPRGTVRLSVRGLTKILVLNQAGRASYSTAGLNLGRHTITATYLGNVNFVGSSGSVAGKQRIV